MVDNIEIIFSHTFISKLRITFQYSRKYYNLHFLAQLLISTPLYTGFILFRVFLTLPAAWANSHRRS